MAVLKGSQTFLKGEVDYLIIVVSDELTGATTDLSTATATCVVYNEDGTTATAPGACTTSGTTTLTVKALWNTTAVAVGTLRALFTVTFGSVVKYFEYKILLLPKPAP